MKNDKDRVRIGEELMRRAVKRVDTDALELLQLRRIAGPLPDFVRVPVAAKERRVVRIDLRVRRYRPIACEQWRRGMRLHDIPEDASRLPSGPTILVFAEPGDAP